MLPISSFRFELLFPPAVRIGFAEVSGLDCEREVIEYRNGSDVQITKTLILGLEKPGTVSAKHGMVAGDNEVYEWFQALKVPGNRRDVQVKLLDELGDPVFVWLLSNTIIASIKGPSLNAGANEITMMSMDMRPESISLGLP